MAMNPGNAEAQTIVNSLRAGGMSYSEIGRRVGRDVSLISQIARKGNKGASLVESLKKVQAGEKQAPAPRRQTASGEQAKVRKGIEKVPGSDNISVKTKKGDKTIIKALTQMSGKGKRVKWKVKVKKAKNTSDFTVKDTGMNGGSAQGKGKQIKENKWSPEDLLNRIQNPQAGDKWQPGEARKALAEIALQENKNSIVSYTGIVEVQLYTVD